MKKAQANVITIVLIILLSLVAVIILWSIVFGTIKSSSGKMNANIFENTFEITDTKVYLNGTTKVSVRRVSGNSSIDSLKFLFYNKNGENVIVIRNNVPAQLETYNYNFEFNEINLRIDRISVVPVIEKNIGMEAKEPDSLIKRDSNGDRIYDPIAGMVSWWMFSGNLKDNIGNNNGKCTADSCPTFAEDRKGNPNGAGEFDGIQDYVEILNKDNINFNKTQNYAIAAWIYVTGHNNTVDTIIEKWDERGTVPYPYVMRIAHNTETIQCALFTGAPATSGYGSGNSITKFIPNSDWHFVLCNFDNPNNNISIWVDDEMENSQIYPILPSTKDIKNDRNLYIGARRKDYHSYSKLDDVIIFNRILNSEEIYALYNNMK